MKLVLASVLHLLVACHLEGLGRRVVVAVLVSSLTHRVGSLIELGLVVSTLHRGGQFAFGSNQVGAGS